MMGGTGSCWGEIWGVSKLESHCETALSTYAFLMVRSAISELDPDEEA